ncbi:MAG: hypothetical protein WCA16_10915 [Candidatus Sulfotelmatobacter sp.]
MLLRRRLFPVFAGAILLCGVAATAQDSGQDSQSLGDAARQARQQKQQAKTTLTKNAKPSKVITNEELPAHVPSATIPTASNEEDSSTMASGNGEKPAEGGKLFAEQWKSQIQSLKSQIASMQRETDELNDSIHFAPGNCVENCVQWNERQKEKQEEVERMRSQLQEQQKRLEDMQESARKQGYGSSVYDP